jgi:hypothetical protein
MKKLTLPWTVVVVVVVVAAVWLCVYYMLS